MSYFKTHLQIDKATSSSRSTNVAYIWTHCNILKGSIDRKMQQQRKILVLWKTLHVQCIPIHWTGDTGEKNCHL